jgi:hypothetical protein
MRHDEGYRFARRHGLLDTIEEEQHSCVADDCQEAIDADSFEAALAVLELASIVVTEPMRAELRGMFGETEEDDHNAHD